MTFSAALLLYRLKKAQMHDDSEIMIDFNAMTVKTLHAEGEAYQEVSLKGFENSIYSTLDYLEAQDCIHYDQITGLAKVTHVGWHALGTTVEGAVKFTVRDIIVPVLVTIAATIILRYI